MIASNPMVLVMQFIPICGNWMLSKDGDHTLCGHLFMEKIMVKICNVGSVDDSFVKINMNLNSGEIVAIRCIDRHKKLLFDIFSGYESRCTGEIFYGRYNWLNISDDERSILNRRYVGIASFQYPLLDTLTMRENISIPLLLDGYEMNSIDISTIIQKLILHKCINRLPHNVSLSEYSRGICARAFVGNKRIVIMDDLYADLNESEKVSNKLLTYWLAKKLKVTLIYITSIQENENFCDIEYIEREDKWEKIQWS